MKLWIKIAVFIIGVFTITSCGISKSVNHLPIVQGYNQEIPNVETISDTIKIYESSFLSKNQHGLWELKISGDPLQLGFINGALTEDLLHYQEKVFFAKVEEFVPSKFKQRLLRGFLRWYNRKLYLHVPEEYKTEIYGLSQYASNDFNHVALPYLRLLYLHAAHDIGHALQDLALVGCTSLAVWDDKSEDGSLLIGRNFDFYVGDDFAKNKIVAFVTPDNGYPFMSITWPGMIGVVSGMNLEGLTVTINAGKSEIPLAAKTPVSIVAREILQYAKNIDEAITIAKQREVFVSEAIMVGSAADGKAILIEMSPEKFDVFEVQNSTGLICSNHFQSDTYKDDPRNLQHIEESHSQYRFERMEELLKENEKLNPHKMAEILRNRKGHNNKNIGYGNEKALNQLLAHHGIVFKPGERLVWVSAPPYQLGTFVAYDLNEIFNQNKEVSLNLETENKNIPFDPFVHATEFKNYEKFRILDRKMDNAISNKEMLSTEFIVEYQQLNPQYWVVYYKTGKYYLQNKWYAAAKAQYENALTKEITTLVDRRMIENELATINRRLP